MRRIFITDGVLRQLVIVIALALLGGMVACGPEDDQTESAPLTDDEVYLIDTYVEIKRAESRSRLEPLVADSLVAAIAAATDTVRVQRTVESINQNPDRWATVFREIEERLKSAP